MDSLISLSRYQEDAHVAISAHSLFDPLFRRRMNVYVCKVPSILDALKDQVIERMDEWAILTWILRLHDSLNPFHLYHVCTFQSSNHFCIID